MVKIDKHIEIVVSPVKSLSSMSSRSSEMVKKTLQKHYTEVGISSINSLDDLKVLVKKCPDLAFIGMEKLPVNDDEYENGLIWIAKYLNDNGILTTGSSSTAIEIEQDKTKAKDVVSRAGLATTPYFIAKKGQFSSESELPFGFPLFIKPPNLGAGVGIGDDSVVRNFKEFNNKVSSLSDDRSTESLVEKYLEGREFTVAVVLDSDRENLLVLPIEQLPVKNSSGDRVIGQEMKDSAVETAVQTLEEGALKESVISLARDVFIALGARDYGRIDMRLDENGIPHFLEANLIPGLIDGSGNFQKSCQMNLGMNYEQMLLHIVNLAFSRARNEEH